MNTLQEQMYQSKQTVKTKFDDETSLLQWIATLNKNVKVDISIDRLSNSNFWYFDYKKGIVTNKNKSFFSIIGLQGIIDKINYEQPIIVQDEIGYLGILCKELDGLLYFLMQAKIEPGNINKVQISPTIQATKSNFLQKHGGKRPNYLDYFLNVEEKNILVDQIQSEQSSRFLCKRNRNIIIKLDEDANVEILPMYKWMTLGQIGMLLKYDNLVNMDTRTVLSCIPFWNEKPVPEMENNICAIYHKINNKKMFMNFQRQVVQLQELKSWEVSDDGIKCLKQSPFDVVYCDINIQGREVTKWTQPMFRAKGKALFAIVMSDINGKKEILVHIKPEIGCLDKVELGPTVQIESTENENIYNNIQEHVMHLISLGRNCYIDVILSEEGGRFYHEENRNIVLLVDKFQIPQNAKVDYEWIDLETLNLLVQFNNVINIQLRNLLTLVEMKI